MGLMLVAGLAGAAAMILPGISGGYLLLLMGAYVPLLSGIDDLSRGLRAGDLGACTAPLMGVVAPVGVGVVIGVVVVGNAVKWLLSHHEQTTLGVLLGLLLGAVVGLYPFQSGHRPEPGDVVKGLVMTAETLADLAPEDWPTRRFTPTPGEGAAAAGLIILGFLTTLAIARVGAGIPAATEESAS
jgi:putative membrane protein